MLRMRDYPILTFDTYGTLIDWESGIWTALQPMIETLDEPPDRETALRVYAQQESAQQAETPNLIYSELLARTHTRMVTRWGGNDDPEAAAAFGRSVGDWPAFDDAAKALAYLRQHHKMATLTNCDPDSYRGSDEKLGHPWDAVWTAGDIGSYKPDPRNFHHMFDQVRERFEIEPEQILHVAQSLFHDHVPAKDLGLATVWIDRRGGHAGGATATPPKEVTPDLRFASMAEMVERHRAEAA